MTKESYWPLAKVKAIPPALETCYIHTCLSVLHSHLPVSATGERETLKEAWEDKISLFLRLLTLLGC